MKPNKKHIIIGASIFTALTILTLLISWGLGLFSNSGLSVDMRNILLESAVSDRVNEKVKMSYEENLPKEQYGLGAVSIIDCESNVVFELSKYPVSDYNEETLLNTAILDEIIKNEIGNITLTVYIKGANITFDQYKNYAYYAVSIIKTELEYKPAFMQLIYYRAPALNETTEVMQYESHVYMYVFDYNERSFINSTNVNFIVEVTGKLAKQAKLYKIIKTIYIVTLTITIIGLTALFIVRTHKKNIKEKEKAARIAARKLQEEDRILKEQENSEIKS